MNDRVCPSCGKTALSVATRCPRCGAGFEARYDRTIEPAANRPRIPGIVLIVIAVFAVGLANALWTRGRPVSLKAPARESAAVRSDSAPAKPVVAQAPAPEKVTPAAQPKPTAQPKPAEPVVTRPAPAPPPPTEIAVSSGSERRFATTWINVRAVRSNRSRVVRVLKPGEAVQVDSLGQGWYRIVSGEQGYADRRLLTSAPPSTRP